MLFSAFEFYQTGLASHVRAETLSVSHIPRIEFLLPAVRNTSVSTAAALGDDAWTYDRILAQEMEHSAAVWSADGGG